jgi:hypothetical protein
MLALAVLAQLSTPRIELFRLAEGELQPRAAVDAGGTLHLVTFRGEPGGGELRYRRSTDGGRTLTEPVPVHAPAARAVATGNVRGAQLAVGRGGRVHVVWNGAAPAATPAARGEAPFFYARLADGGGAFEAARDLAGEHHGLDGGGAVAADESGNVWVVWHAPGDGGPDPGEAGRRVFVARSRDDGASFEPAVAASEPGSGVCPCCGLGARATGDGGLAILYRSARERVRRDTIALLSGPDASFRAERLDEWSVSACVMSTFALARGPRGTLGAFESSGQVRCVSLAAPLAGDERVAPGDDRTRKHPSIAVAPDGSVLLAWTEGMGWGRGGALAWQLFDPAGAPVAAESGRRAGVPAWSLVQAVALPDGRFALFY